MEGAITPFFLKKYLDTPISYVKGVGPFRSSIFKSIGCNNIRDLLFHIPVRFIDRTHLYTISEVAVDDICTLCVVVESVIDGKILRILCSDPTGGITIVYFNHQGKEFKDKFRQGQKIFISGKISIDKYAGLQMHHPDIISTNIEDVAIVEPIYRASLRLSSRMISKITRTALKLLI